MSRIELAVACALVLGACERKGSGQAEPGDLAQFTEVHALEDHTALVIVESDAGDSLERIDDHGTRLWKAPLRGDATVNAGVLVDGDIALVRHFDAQATSVTAVALATGEPRWDTAIGSGSRVDDGGVYLTAIAFDGVVAEAISHDATTAQAETTIVGIDPKLGTVLWSWTTKGDVEAPMATDHLLALHQGSDALLFDRTGFRSRVTTLGVGCAVDGGDIELVSQPRGAMLVQLAAGDVNYPRVIAGPIAPAPARSSAPFLHGCGSYANKLVLSIEDGAEDHRETYVVVVEGGNVVATIALGRVDLTASSNSELGSLSGPLTRFVPVTWMDLTERAPDMHLAMLDLERGTVAWRGARDDSAYRGALFRRGTHWYLLSQGSVLHVFDGATGELVAATRVAIPLAWMTFRPAQVAGDEVWLVGLVPGRGAVAAIRRGSDYQWPLAILDATTLAPRFTRALDVRDVTSATRARLDPR